MHFQSRSFVPEVPAVNYMREDGGDSCCGLTWVTQGSAGVVEGIGGEFKEVIPPGFKCLIPCSERLGGTVCLRTHFMEASITCPTLDNASVRCTIDIAYRVIPALVHQAYYKLSATREQIHSFVAANLRSEIRGIALDGLFEYRERLAERLNAYLAPIVAGFGHEIVDVLVIEIEPVGEVRQAMNEQKYQYYMRLGNRFVSEGQRLVKIKEAEGGAEADRLRGVGQAEATKAITSSMQAGMSGGSVPEATVMSMMLMLQYFDMIKDITSEDPHPPVYFMPARLGGPEDNMFARRHQQLKSLLHHRKNVQPIHADDI